MVEEHGLYLMTKDDLHAFLRSRRSIRRFKQAPVPHDCIQRILETAIFAPSAHNLQPWRFAVITSSAVKERLAEAITIRFRQDMIVDGIPEAEIQARVKRTVRRTSQAPVIIILCRDTTQVKPQTGSLLQQEEALMGTQSVALAGLQLLLAAHSEGLGGTWICWPLFTREETRHALGLAKEWEPQGMLFLGYPDEKPELPERESLQEVVRYI
jgi:F420 biosynthesis protein FbiB-like protein